MRRKTFADGGDVAKGFFYVKTSAFSIKEEGLKNTTAQTCQRQRKMTIKRLCPSGYTVCSPGRFLILGDKRARGKMATTNCGKVGMTAR